MDDGGIQEEPPSARFLTPTRSGGTRWVDGSEVDSSESAPSWSLEDERSAGAVSSNGGVAAASRVSSGAFRRRLGKRPRRVDSLDVESMNVRGAHGHSAKVRSFSRSPRASVDLNAP
jgi:KUP system potassium uptake protein